MAKAEEIIKLNRIKMKAIYLILIMVLTLTVSDYSQLRKDLDKSRIPVSSELIDNILKHNKKDSPVKTVVSLFKIVAPDSVIDSDTSYYVMNSILTDLDGDDQTELLCLFGPNDNDTILGVFAKENNQWYLIYAEPVYSWNVSPEMTVANNYSRNKLFYLRGVGDRGSGVYLDYFDFYKLINGKVYKCLSLVNRAHISGWRLYINQFIDMKFEIATFNQDDIWVRYKYTFRPGNAYSEDLDLDSLRKLSFVDGEDGVSYKWDSSSFSYIPDFYMADSLSLNAAKVSCFGAFGNDKLFAKAFSNEINEKLKTGNREEVKLLKEFLSSINDDEPADNERKKK